MINFGRYTVKDISDIFLNCKKSCGYCPALPSTSPSKILPSHSSLVPSYTPPTTLPKNPSERPIESPSESPTSFPTDTPSKSSTFFPTDILSKNPTLFPSLTRSEIPALSISVLPSTSPTGSCHDNATFQDQFGFYCVLYSGAPCEDMIHIGGYSNKDVAAIIINCRRSCGYCQAPPTTYPSNIAIDSPSQVPSITPVNTLFKKSSERPTGSPSESPTNLSEGPTSFIESPTYLPSPSLSSYAPTSYSSCRDNPNFQDKFGFFCILYSGAPCEDLIHIGYSKRDLVAILLNCKKSCGDCPASQTAPSSNIATDEIFNGLLSGEPSKFLPNDVSVLSNPSTFPSTTYPTYVIFNPAITACVDDLAYKFHGKKKMMCQNWVVHDLRRCNNYHANRKAYVYQMCPLTCGACYIGRYGTRYPTGAPTRMASDVSPRSFSALDADVASESPSPHRIDPFSHAYRPSAVPSDFPSFVPAHFPSKYPSVAPSVFPSNFPSENPTTPSSFEPTNSHTTLPSYAVTEFSTVGFSAHPGDRPSRIPSPSPSGSPFSAHSRDASPYPTDRPSHGPNTEPTAFPSRAPTTKPPPSSNFPSNPPIPYPTDFPPGMILSTTSIPTAASHLENSPLSAPPNAAIPPIQKCADDLTFRDYLGKSCKYYVSSDCSDVAFNAVLKKMCPRSCGLCGPKDATQKSREEIFDAPGIVMQEGTNVGYLVCGALAFFLFFCFTIYLGVRKWKTRDVVVTNRGGAFSSKAAKTDLSDEIGLFADHIEIDSEREDHDDAAVVAPTVQGEEMNLMNKRLEVMNSESLNRAHRLRQMLLVSDHRRRSELPKDETETSATDEPEASVVSPLSNTEDSLIFSLSDNSDGFDYTFEDGDSSVSMVSSASNGGRFNDSSFSTGGSGIYSSSRSGRASNRGGPQMVGGSSSSLSSAMNWVAGDGETRTKIATALYK